MSTHRDRAAQPLTVTVGEAPADWCRQAGIEQVHDATHPSSYLDPDGELRPRIAFFDGY